MWTSHEHQRSSDSSFPGQPFRVPHEAPSESARALHRSPELSRVVHELEQENVEPIVVASHPRCGTHLLLDTLRMNFTACRSWKYCGERLDRLYLNLDHLALVDSPLSPETAQNILRRINRPLVKTHAWPDFREVLLESQTRRFNPQLLRWLNKQAKFLYIYRDGRDAMTSLHFFMQDYDPSARVSIGQFIRQKVNGQSRPRLWARHVRSWCENPSIYCVKMEELLTNSLNTICTLAQHLNLPLHADPVLPSRTKSFLHSRFNRVFGICPQSTAILSTGRSRTGEWRNMFTRDDREFFLEQTEGLLTTLGYESSDDWASDPHIKSKLPVDRTAN